MARSNSIQQPDRASQSENYEKLSNSLGARLDPAQLCSQNGGAGSYAEAIGHVRSIDLLNRSPGFDSLAGLVMMIASIGLDYSKGLAQRVDAFEHFLGVYPDCGGR
jgi:hypothetical protein